MPDLALTRSCRFADFPGCRSVADWQQAIVHAAYDRWLSAPQRFVGTAHALCINWGGCAFEAPGDPIYRLGPDIGTRRGDRLSAIFALSVLDRVDMPMRFLKQQVERLLPGGLLVCTFACWDVEGPDCAIGKEIRRRIYNPDSWLLLVDNVRKLSLRTFGGIDWTYHGHTLGDHTLATLVLTKGTV